MVLTSIKISVQKQGFIQTLWVVAHGLVFIIDRTNLTDWLVHVGIYFVTLFAFIHALFQESFPTAVFPIFWKGF